MAGINFGDFSQTPYFLIWRILNLAIWSLDQNDITSTPARASVGPCRLSATSYQPAMEIYEVESCIRGHHVFRTVWSPTVGERLNCTWETSNTEDPYAVAVMHSSAVIGHISRKISAVGALFLGKEGTIHCTIIGSWPFTTNLPHGGLEVPCILTFRGKSQDVARMKKLVLSMTCSNPGETQQPRKKRKIDSETYGLP